MDDASWEAVVDLERQEYDRGYAAGYQDSITSTEDASGYSQGLLKGYAVGFEAGFIVAAASTLLDQPATGRETALTERGKRIAEETKSRGLKLPNYNDGETDFDEEIQFLRSKYKQLGSTYGPCPPKPSGSDQKPSAPASHEW